MSNVLPFGEKKPVVDLAPNAGLVGANGEKVQTTRSVQNDILQRRNFILIDVGTLETIVSSGNVAQAYAALNAAMPQLLFNTVQQIAGRVAVQVFKQTALEEGAKPEGEAVTESSPE